MQSRALAGRILRLDIPKQPSLIGSIVASEGLDGVLYRRCGVLVIGAGGEGKRRSEADFHPAAAEEREPRGHTDPRDIQAHGHYRDPPFNGHQAGPLHERLQGASYRQHSFRVNEDRPTAVHYAPQVLQTRSDGSFPGDGKSVPEKRVEDPPDGILPQLSCCCDG